MASALGGGGSNNSHNPNDLSVVYRAVASGASAEQVRAILEGGPRTRRARAEWLTAVLEYKGGPNNDETALQAAHRRRDGPVVGALLEHGADARAVGPSASPLTVCIAYGQAGSLRILLRSGRPRADEEIVHRPLDGGDAYLGASRPVHVCVRPPALHRYECSPPPQLECLDVLVREFGADVSARNEPDRETPLLVLGRVDDPVDWRRAFDALMALGADLNAADSQGKTLIFQVDGLERLQLILELGTSPNVIARDGRTPLYRACRQFNRAMISALLPLTSTEARRSIPSDCDLSALDWLLLSLGPRPRPWRVSAIEALLLSRVPVNNRANAARALPFAARLGERLAAEAAAHASDPPPWQVHEAMVGMAFDFQELREAEAAVEERERRVEELEEELRRREEAGEDGDDNGKEEEEKGEEMDEGAARSGERSAGGVPGEGEGE